MLVGVISKFGGDGDFSCEYLPWGAFSSCEASLWHCATGEPASAESSSFQGVGGFLPTERQKTLEEMSSVHIPPIVQQVFQEGKMSAARATPAISGGLIWVGLVV